MFYKVPMTSLPIVSRKKERCIFNVKKSVRIYSFTLYSNVSKLEFSVVFSND